MLRSFVTEHQSEYIYKQAILESLQVIAIKDLSSESRPAVTNRLKYLRETFLDLKALNTPDPDEILSVEKTKRAKEEALENFIQSPEAVGEVEDIIINLLRGPNQ